MLNVPALSQERLREILHYDPRTGIFHRLISSGGIRAGNMAGYLHKSTGYWYIKVDGHCYPAHRLAWIYMTGQWPQQIDHKNCDQLDNRFENLREATSSDNGANRRCYRNNLCRIKGVHRFKSRGQLTDKWRAQIKKNGRVIHLGLFDSIPEAAAAYRSAAISMHGEFARFV